MTNTAVLETQLDLTLDPENWNETREAAHRALETVLNYQMGVRDKPAWQQVPEELEAFFKEDAPRKGEPISKVVDDILQKVAPYHPGHSHPRFWGWVCGTGTPVGMIADMVAAGVNSSAGTFNEAATRLEDQVLVWMRDLFGFPEGASGIITSGASMANVIGLAVARDAILREDVRKNGLSSIVGVPTVYCSGETHSSVGKGMMLLGLGVDNLRKVPTDESYHIRMDLLESMIAEDRAAGKVPIALVANAGTVNTGVIDDMEAMAVLAKKEGIWLHVDGAIGGLGVLSPKIRKQLKGMELADSIAFDFHKWMYVPYEAGCVLVRDGAAHRKSFTVAANYLEVPERGVAAVSDQSNIRGPQLSRGFKALKVWAQIKEHGLDGLGAMLEQNIAHIQYLKGLIDAAPELERLNEPELNIICFRYLSENLGPEETDALNMEILIRIQEQGIAVPSSTRLEGKLWLRVANTNHRTRREDFDFLIREILRVAGEIQGI